MTTREYVVAYNSLCERVDRCTCGVGPGGYYGLHEPGCGLEQIASLEQIFAALAAQAARPAPPEPNLGPLPDGGIWAGFCERCDTLGCPGDCGETR